MEIELSKVRVRTLTKPDEIDDAKTVLSRAHYLGDCKPQYRRLYQVAEYQGEWLGVLLWDQCVKHNSVREAYIGWSTEARELHRTQVVNNKRFCIGEKFKGVTNLGSRILGLSVKALPVAWRERYGEDVLLCETFVDPERYEGTSYLAAGWEDVGMSAGYDIRNKATGKYETTHPKKVFVKPLEPHAKELLCLPYRSIRGELENQQQSRKIDEAFAKLDMGRLRKGMETITDHRNAQGRRHSALTLLMSISLAIFTGCRGYQSIWDWLSHLAPSFRKELGMRKVPSISTISRFMRRLDIEALNKVVYGWLIEQSSGLTGQKVTFDGKVLRGTKDSDGKQIELLSAVLAPAGITIAQAQVSEKTNEIPVAQDMMKTLPIEGKVVVADALHTQKKTAEEIKKKDADFLFRVKDNQSNLANAILETPQEFLSAPHTQVDKDRGRLVTRTLQVAETYTNEFDFPHINQYGILIQTTEFPISNKKPRHETFAIITSMSAQNASPERLLDCFRSEWIIENKSHYVRDVTFDEDRCRIRTGNAPINMATMRNLAISTMRLLSFTNIAQAIRHFTYRPDVLFQGFGYKVSSAFSH